MPQFKTRKYAWPVRAIHWLSAILILVAYLTSELSEEIEEGEYAGPDWHVAAGLSLLLLFLPRVLARVLTRTPPIVPPPARWSVLAAKLTTLALVLFVVVQPVLGVLLVWSEGHALVVPFLDIAIPPMVALGHGAEDTLEEAHELLGNAFYAVIALHALAALWHHFARRDDTLRRML
ncbi:MAG: cytochrome b [Lysobacter sp.]|nr:cytochrome b [Lysobacter sp.]